MITDNKQHELKQCRAVILEILNYLASKLSGSLVFDNYDPIAKHYDQQKNQTEKYYKLKKLDKLQQTLNNITIELYKLDDLTCIDYTKKDSQYDSITTEDLQKKFEDIFSSKKLSNQKELDAINALLNYYRITPQHDSRKHLDGLILKYAQANSSIRRDQNFYQLPHIKRQDIERYGTRITASTGQKINKTKEEVILAPNRKYSVRISKSGIGEMATTYVSIEFQNSSGAIFDVKGLNTDLKIFWKDNHTLLIQLGAAFSANLRCQKVSSYEDTVNIEYRRV